MRGVCGGGGFVIGVGGSCQSAQWAEEQCRSIGCRLEKKIIKEEGKFLWEVEFGGGAAI